MMPACKMLIIGGIVGNKVSLIMTTLMGQLLGQYCDYIIMRWGCSLIIINMHTWTKGSSSSSAPRPPSRAAGMYGMYSHTRPVARRDDDL